MSSDRVTRLLEKMDYTGIRPDECEQTQSKEKIVALLSAMDYSFMDGRRSSKKK